MQKPSDINQLVGQFLDLQEQWENDPDIFNWDALRALATAGAQCYNEGNGRSFQILCIDGMQHGEFHLRFLTYSIEAGFDPFKLVHTGTGQSVEPAFGHESLADAAIGNPWSARMQARLQNLARTQFGVMAENGTSILANADLARTIACCRDSIPADLVESLLNTGLVAEQASEACC